MTFPILQKVCGDVSAVNAQAVTNVRFRCGLLFSDVSDAVVALYSPFQTCLQSCYEYG
jgi:hypothetical protein